MDTQPTGNSVYLRGGMWDFRSRRGQTKFHSSYFLLLDSPLHPPTAMMYYFLHMNKNRRIFKNPMECSRSEAAAILGAVSHYLCSFPSDQKGLKEPQRSPQHC